MHKEKKKNTVEQKNVKNKYTITRAGSLGLLALGHTGLRLWRDIVKEEEKNKKNG